MLQTMVSLQDAERAIHVQVHDGLVDIVLAALSAEPVTVHEVQAAMARFVAPSVAESVFQGARDGIAVKSVEGGHMIIDLPGKLVVNRTPAPEMPRLGNVLSCDEDTTLDVWLPYRIPDDWHMTTDDENWDGLAAERRRKLAETPPVDVRAALYGKLAGCLVQQWVTTAATSQEPDVEIHDWWLLTPRDDLHGRTPREVLLVNHRFIDGDVQDQGQIWSLAGACPPGLSQRSHAYRYGGFGTQEIILYHELVAVLLHECQRRIGSRQDIDVRGEVCHLEQLQQEWLHQPQADLYDQSPAALIARERSRLPAVVPKGHDGLHDDCPLCRMMADSNQPMIWQLDNYMLEKRFATSFCATRDEWERARQEWEELERDWEDSSIVAAAPESPEEKEPRVWNSSHTNMQFFADMPPIEACGVMLFSVGGHLAELVQDLRAGKNEDRLVQQLHNRFDELRTFLNEGEDTWMINTSVSEFVDALNDVTGARDDLRAKCADLEDKLGFLAKRYAEHFGQDLEAAY